MPPVAIPVSTSVSIPLRADHDLELGAGERADAVLHDDDSPASRRTAGAMSEPGSRHEKRPVAATAENAGFRALTSG